MTETHLKNRTVLFSYSSTGIHTTHATLQNFMRVQIHTQPKPSFKSQPPSPSIDVQLAELIEITFPFASGSIPNQLLACVRVTSSK